jgi:hypothetical protein
MATDPWRLWSPYCFSYISTYTLIKIHIEFVDRDSVVAVVNRYGLDGPVIESRWGEIFRTRPGRFKGPTRPPLQWVRGLFSGDKADRSVALTTHPI